MTDMLKLSLPEFAQALASPAPVPGGGGAAALAGALGVALGGMVGALTLGKEKHADVEAEMLLLSQGAAKLRAELLELVREDAEAFAPLSRAYGLPRGTEEEKAERARVLELALEAAAAPPLLIMEKCGEAIALLADFAEKGNPMVASDAGTGAALCKAALEGARLNVLANSSMMRDRARAELLEGRAEKLAKEHCPRADAVYGAVLRALGG